MPILVPRGLAPVRRGGLTAVLEIADPGKSLARGVANIQCIGRMIAPPGAPLGSCIRMGVRCGWPLGECLRPRFDYRVVRIGVSRKFQAITAIAAEIAWPAVARPGAEHDVMRRPLGCGMCSRNMRSCQNRIEVESLITLGHLSDLHATDPSRTAPAALLGKRLSGWLSCSPLRSRRMSRSLPR